MKSQILIGLTSDTLPMLSGVTEMRAKRHHLVGALERRGVGFRSLRESIDTASSGGRLIFHLFGALAEFERELIRERTTAGLAAARVRGRKGGRPTVMTIQKLATARLLLGQIDESGRHSRSVREVAEVIGTSRATLYRALRGETKRTG